MTSTRTNTPDRINPDGSRTITSKRACNGCEAYVGDVTDHEMALAIAGAPLPDVRSECPNCGPTAPEPTCQPTQIVAGDALCLEMECDHTGGGGSYGTPPDSYCDEVAEEVICTTHSDITNLGEIVRAASWPCQHGTKATR